MQRPPIHISEKYRSQINRLLRAAGYDDAHLEEGVRDLRDYIAGNDHFYPEDIARGFIATSNQNANQTDQEARLVHRATAEIVQAGFFNDGGVESYAAPCAPMVLGLAEIAAQAAAERADTRFVLGSADISNLGGLNKLFEDRNVTAPTLAHLVHAPREAVSAWATAHGYHVDTLIIRMGGDEFKYSFRMRTIDGNAIDDARFAEEIQGLNTHITAVNHALSRECGIEQILHLKEERAPGVMNTVALRALNPQSPNIQNILVELGGDIAAQRTAQAAETPAPSTSHQDIISLKSTLPAPYHPLPATNPYQHTALTPDIHESLETFSLRMALEKAEFPDLATIKDLFTYDPKARWSVLNTMHPDFFSLEKGTQLLVRGVIEAEHMRGVIDPVSRSYSVAFLNQCRELAHYQGRTKALRVHLQNLGGMNLLGDALGDAILRETGAAIDAAYDTHFSNDKRQKPMVARCGGGEFAVFFDEHIPQSKVREFSLAVRHGIERINATTINEFSKVHRLGDALSKSAQNGYVWIGDIACPKNLAHGANFGLSVTFEGEQYEKRSPSSWQETILTEPPPYGLVRR